MRSQLSRTLLTTTALVPLAIAVAHANPVGSQVVGGSASVQGTGTATVTVTQTSDKAIINWKQFDIGAGEKTQFVQPSSSSVALNRVTGGLGASLIDGTLTANGRIFLVNPDGVLFGKGAVVDTAGFLATTHDITNDNFMAGRYHFNIPGRPDASIVNQGTITATGSGFAARVAPGVRNSGTITANFGQVGLAAGNGFTLDFYGDKLITLAVNDSIAATVRDVATGQPLDALIKNEGKLKANGGRVELTAVAARTVIDSVINNRGVIEARSIGTRNGKIVLGAATTRLAGMPKQTVKLSGKLTVAGKKAGSKGGTIVVTGENIELAGATIDASGGAGGGTVLIGGDWAGGNPKSGLVANQSARLEGFSVPTAATTSVDAATIINASAKDSGDAGKVVLWSDQVTSFLGTILARGGAASGNGGFAEVSGHQSLGFAGTVDLRAPRGTAGTLLLDPTDIVIGSNGTVTGGSASLVEASALVSQLSLGNVVVATSPTGSGNGDIKVVSNVAWSGNNSLTLSAHRDIGVAAGVGIANTGGGNLTMRADSEGTGRGTVSLAVPPGGGGQGVGTSVDFSGSTGKVSIYYNPTSYSSPVSYASNVVINPAVQNQLIPYMLVNDATNLQNISQNLSGAYALGRNIDASGFTGTGAGEFKGIFDGHGGLGVNHAIDKLPVGLFSTIGFSGTVRNLNLTDVAINAPNGLPLVGSIAGTNLGTIDSVTASGSINGGSQTGLSVGGFVGVNSGTIRNSSAAVNVSAGDGIVTTLQNVGGMVGFNSGTIMQSSASGTVTVGANANAGGLVGANMTFLNQPLSLPPLIDRSFATGNVMASGVNVQAGGLAGYNAPTAVITDSHATGNVTASASVTQGSPGQFSQAGGLVGFNQGVIAGTTDPSPAYATGAVRVGSGGIGGGLVGFNDGIIANAYATGAVTGDAGVAGPAQDHDRPTTLGGLVGFNLGQIVLGSAQGNVGTPNVAFLQAGGLVGRNAGAIVGSNASGDVRAGDNSEAGGLVGGSGADGANCGNCSQGIGFNNDGAIAESSATGSVTVGSESIAGGLAGLGGSVLNSSASGAVTGAGNSILGGFMGVLTTGESIANSVATGSVTSTGPNTWAGGFVGIGAGVISGSSSSGAVLGTSASLLGGFTGVNIGQISLSFAEPTASVTGTGANNVIGGFAGVNFGSISLTSAEGAVTGGVSNAVGGLVGANAAFANIPPDLIALSSFPTGTIFASNATGAVSGGANSIVNQQVAINGPTSLPTYPSLIPKCNDEICSIFQTASLTTPPKPGLDELPLDVLAQALIINLVLTIEQPTQQDVVAALVALTPPESQPGAPGSGPSAPSRGTGPQGVAPPPPPLRPVSGPDGERFSSVPPLTETRFLSNEVVLQVGANIPAAQIAAIAQQLGLSIVATQPLGSTNRTAYRFNITSGRSVRDIIRALEANSIVAVAQPNYRYRLQQPAAANGERRGDPSQYMMTKLRLDEAHRIAAGNDIIVAVIDSEVDREHSELAGAISEQFDATGADSKAHSHGTAMIGAIAAQDRLLGVAPRARILAIRAFSEADNTAESTTFNILKSIDWAVSQGARVINMSFAGPPDPSLQRTLKSAYDRGVVLIAAAGNAGPKSPPLYPGADPSVIAVTATDSEDRGFRQANRGFYVAIAAPGVEILAAAPQAGYQLSTGTSIATAHVSGVVALMLQRDPTLTPAAVRQILESTAVDLGPKGRDTQYGWGLVNPHRALLAVEARRATAKPATTP